MLTWKEMLQRAPRRSVTVADAVFWENLIVGIEDRALQLNQATDRADLSEVRSNARASVSDAVARETSTLALENSLALNGIAQNRRVAGSGSHITQVVNDTSYLISTSEK